MPTLEAGSRFDNIARSVNVYVRDQLVTGLGYTVYQEQDRTGTLPDRWIEVDLLPGDGVGDLTPGPGYGVSTWVQCLLNINCYEHLETGVAGTNLYALIDVVENVRHRFLATTSIPIHDYATVGHPWVGALMIWGRPEVTEIRVAPDAGIRQVNISVPLRYHEVVSIS